MNIYVAAGVAFWVGGWAMYGCGPVVHGCVCLVVTLLILALADWQTCGVREATLRYDVSPGRLVNELEDPVPYTYVETTWFSTGGGGGGGCGDPAFDQVEFAGVVGMSDAGRSE